MSKKNKTAISRRKKNALLIAFFFLFLPSLSLLDHQTGVVLRRIITRSLFYTDDQRTYHRQWFTVVNVIDGDTLDVQSIEGSEEITRIRLLGIDTPETKHPTIGVMYYGPEASSYVKGLAENQRVRILMDSTAEPRDYYGRLLAYIELEDGRILNEEIIKNGYGYADLRFAHSDFHKYERSMDQAIAARVGLWKEVCRDQFPAWLRQERPLLLR